jgi:predicted nucleic acid-binding protein
MEPALLGLVLDASAVIGAERNRQPIPEFIEAILQAHGIYRAKTAEAGQRRRDYIEALISLIPVHPATNRTAWLVGQIEGQEAAKGNVLRFNDLMTAAAAIEQGYAVLTGNLRHFHRIPGLTVVSF